MWTSGNGDVEPWKVPPFPLKWCLREFFSDDLRRSIVMAVPRTIGRERVVRLCVAMLCGTKWMAAWT